MRSTLVGIAALLSCTGCAHMEFSKTDNERGIPFYTSVPYILLTTNADCSTAGNVLYLPDLAHPRYAIPHPGYGANNLTIALANGMMSSFGQQTDTKVPETLTALGSLATALPKVFALNAPATQTTTCPKKQAKLYRVDDKDKLVPVDIP